MTIKLKGQVIQMRGARTLYPVLEDLDRLYELRRQYPRKVVGEMLGIPQGSLNSIRAREKQMPQEWQDKLVSERRPHKRTRRGR